MDILIFCLVAIAASAITAHLISVMLVMWRARAGLLPEGKSPEPLTVLRPVCGIDHRLYETLASSFPADSSGIEVIFCVARDDDPAIEVIRQVMADHPEADARLMTGDVQVSGNPKLNNLVRGWEAAKHDWIVMIDSNVLLPQNYVHELFATWRPGTGLVSAPAQGTDANGFWAEVECAFLNTYQARWQLAADQMGNGFAQGKVLFWRRDILDAAGGPAALGGEIAEDVASTKLVRKAGLEVRVLPRPYPQPLGRREARAVWQRQLRWSRIRRSGFPVLFTAELLSGPVVPLAALIVLAGLGEVSVVALPLLLLLWYGGDLLVSWAEGWPVSARGLGAEMMRDALLPFLWAGSFSSADIMWRGSQVGDPDLDAHGAA